MGGGLESGCVGRVYGADGAVRRGGAVGRGIALQAGRSWVRFPMTLEFFIDNLPAALWPWS